VAAHGCDASALRLRLRPQDRPPHLQSLGAPEPELPRYDPKKHEPIAEIPIELEDEQTI